MNVGKYNFQVAIGLRTFNPYEGTDQLVSDSKLYSIVAVKTVFNAKSESTMKIAKTHSCTQEDWDQFYEPTKAYKAKINALKGKELMYCLDKNDV